MSNFRVRVGTKKGAFVRHRQYLDPAAVYAKAVAAGATGVVPVAEAHGWRIGRIVDPFGHHWEIARPTCSQ